MIAIVDYKAGNLTSVQLAFEALGTPVEVTQDPSRILKANKVVFPGVGAAGDAMRNLREMGLIDPLRAVVSSGTPFLGICIGMQLLLDSSEEDGGIPCLGIIPGTVKRFRPVTPLDKIPQIGWNTVKIKGSHPLFSGIEDESEFYFVHSYYPSPSNPEDIHGETEYADARFASVAGRKNLFATQFHPERSGRIGLRILENFCSWEGTC